MGQNDTSCSSNKLVDSETKQQLVIIGSIGKPFGVAGWLKINSYTEPKSNILNYKTWFLLEANTTSQKYIFKYIQDFKQLNNQIIVLFKDLTDRNQAANLTNKKIAIARKDLPNLIPNEYYWVDLIGCEVYNLTKQFLGKLDHIFETAANTIMVIKMEHLISTINVSKQITNIDQDQKNCIAANNKEYLIPYSVEIVKKVDLTKRIILVDWILG